MTTFTVTLSQMTMLFLFMIIGYLLRKTGKMPGKATDAISTLLLYIFMPATCYKSFADHCTPEVLLSQMPLILAGFAVLLACLLIGWCVSRLITKDARMRDVCIFVLVVSNLGYVGFPLTEAVFGSEMLFGFMVFCMPFNLFIYSFGMYLMNPQKKLTFKIFSSPTILAIFAGMLVGLVGITLPAPVIGAVDAASASMAPCAMIVTGLVLADIPLKATFSDLRAYLLTAIRLIGLPVLFALLALLLKLPAQLSLIGTTMLCLPAGLNCVVFARAYGGDSESGAKVCFLSALFGMITIPLIYAGAAMLFT